MAINIKNQDVDRLLDEVVGITGESKTEAVRQALEERRRRIALRTPGDVNGRGLRVFLEDEVWSQIPAELLGVSITKAEEERILGYGEESV